MEIQCQCGQFRAELKSFPKDTPGRLKCYCDDCQSYLHFIKRADLLDEHGGTEIIPAYPSDIRFIAGQETLACVRLSPRGMYRYYTSCCNTPVANLDPQRPWAGIHRRMYTAKDPQALDRAFPSVKASIMGKFAKGKPPAGTPNTFDFTGMRAVFPFLIKGKLFGKAKPSPFFENGSPVGELKVLTKLERDAARTLAGF
jgi:hypothetical protein